MQEEKKLFEGCLLGDEFAWKALFDQYLPLMHAICLRYVGVNAEADDLVQEGFMKIFAKLDSFRWKGRGSFVGWMKRIMVNHAINAYKKKARNVMMSIDAGGADIEAVDDADTGSVVSEAMDCLTQQEVIECVGLLPEQFRLVFNMFAIDGLKHKEIAELLDIPLKTSTTRYMRAKAKLKTILEARIALKMQAQRVG